MAHKVCPYCGQDDFEVELTCKVIWEVDGNGRHHATIYEEEPTIGPDTEFRCIHCDKIVEPTSIINYGA